MQYRSVQLRRKLELSQDPRRPLSSTPVCHRTKLHHDLYGRQIPQAADPPTVDVLTSPCPRLRPPPKDYYENWGTPYSRPAKRLKASSGGDDTSRMRNKGEQKYTDWWSEVDEADEFEAVLSDEVFTQTFDCLG